METRDVQTPEALQSPAAAACKADWLARVGLVLLALATYLPVLFNSFVQLDDAVTVYRNSKLKPPTVDSLSSFWTAPQEGLYAPFTYTYYAGVSLLARAGWHDGKPPDDYFLAWPFHAGSLLMHCLATLAAFHLLRELRLNAWPAAAGAALFAVHPVQVESVAWVAESNNLLCGLFSILAILALVRAARFQQAGAPYSVFHVILATEAFVFAVLSKPTGVVVPALAFITLAVSCTRFSVRITATLFVWAILAGVAAIIARVSQPVPGWWLDVPTLHRPQVAADALAFYVGKIFWPAALTPDYGRSPDAIWRSGAAAYTWILPVTIALVVILLRRRTSIRPWSFGLLWMLVALAPVLGFTTFAFQRFSTPADRYLYIPLVGLAYAVGRTLQRHRSRALTSGTCVLLAVFAVRSCLQTFVWRDTDSLYRNSKALIGRVPGSASLFPAPTHNPAATNNAPLPGQ